MLSNIELSRAMIENIIAGSICFIFGIVYYYIYLRIGEYMDRIKKENNEIS